MSTIQQEKEIDTNKPTKNYDEVAIKVRKLLSASVQTFIPELADGLRKDWCPELSDEQIRKNLRLQKVIRKKIFDEWSKEGGYSEDNIWTEQTIVLWFPKWLRNPVQEQANQEPLAKAHEALRQKQIRKSLISNSERNTLTKLATNLPKTVIIPKASEPEPISEEKLHDLGLGSYGESHKSVHRVRNEIHEGIRLLFKALCDDKDLPNDEDDLIVDYIKPTREYRLGLAMEFDQPQRTNMHNKLHFVIAAAEDMIEQIDKADKK